MKPIAIAALAGVLLSTVANAQPPPPRMALHNGSLMQVAEVGPGRIEITYVQPRPSLWGVVYPGELLLAGQWDHGTLNATAFVFTQWCPHSFPYPVTGSMNQQGILTVVGQAPVIDAYSCTVIGQTWSANSTLVFVPQP